MSQIEDAIREHIKLCREDMPRIYVPWAWLIGVVIMLLGSIGTTAWALSRSITRTEFAVDANTRAIDEQKARIARLEEIAATIRDMRSDVQTIREQTALPGYRMRREFTRTP